MPMSSFKTFYDVLGVDKDASIDDVRKAYRKKALETHPDKLDPSATEEGKQAAKFQFHKVHEAFETLGDSQKRRAYDARLSMRADPRFVSEETARRTAERREWARKQQQEAQKQAEAFKEKIRREREAKEMAKAREIEEAAMTADILREMYESIPGLTERREAALRRKAERERAERPSRGQLLRP